MKGYALRYSWKCTIYLKNKLDTFVVFEVFLQAMKCAMFDYLPTNTKIKFIPHQVQGRHNKKWIGPP